MNKTDYVDVVKLISDIKLGTLYNSLAIALSTEKLLHDLISKGQWENAKELMQLIKCRIEKISTDLPQEVIASNVMRHILKLIREEHELLLQKKGKEQSLHELLTSHESDTLDYSKSLNLLKNNLLDHLIEYREELESSSEVIAAQALEHIHANEIIMTVGKSKTVEEFLIYASKKRTFQVIVVEGAPYYYGHTMADSLLKNNIQVTVIPDSAVFAMMSRINKVIIGTHSVMADGGLRAASGVHSVALAAKHYSVPVLVLTHMYKFAPVYVCSYGQSVLNVFGSPANVIPYSSGEIIERADIYNPIFDYVPPDLVTLLISHQGGNATSYVYRLLSELYHPDDYNN